MKVGDRIKFSNNTSHYGLLAGACGEVKEVVEGGVRVLLDPTPTTRWTGREFWVGASYVHSSGRQESSGREGA